MFFRHHRCPKWHWSTQQDSSMHLIHGTNLLSTPLPLWTSIITLGKKNNDKKHCLLKQFGLVTYKEKRKEFLLITRIFISHRRSEQFWKQNAIIILSQLN